MNDRDIAALKPTGKKREISLSERALYLVVQPSGAKSFMFRPMIAGKLKRIKLGDYPSMRLREAKDALYLQRAQLASGEIPVEPKRVAKASGLTFNQAWALYMEHEGDSRASANERWRIFRKDIEPAFGAKPLHEVDRDDIEALLLAKAKTAPVASNVIYTLLCRMFTWCMKQGHVHTKLKASPMANVAAVGSNGTPRERYLNDDELKWFFQAIDEGTAGVFKNGLLATLYTGQRCGRIFEATREQLEGDTLTIAMKDPKPDRPTMTTPIWLHPDVMALIPEATKDSKPTDRLFEGRKDDLNKATSRIAARMEEIAREEGKTCAHWSPHDLRRTMATWMGDQTDEDEEPLISEFIIERCLSHIERSVRAKHYSKNKYLKSKKRAWQLYGDHLSSLRASTSN